MHDYVCTTCGNVYDSFYISNASSIKCIDVGASKYKLKLIQDCPGEVHPIDDLVVPHVKFCIQNKIPIIYSCGGHLSPTRPPYLCFESKDSEMHRKIVAAFKQDCFILRIESNEYHTDMIIVKPNIKGKGFYTNVTIGIKVLAEFSTLSWQSLRNIKIRN